MAGGLRQRRCSDTPRGSNLANASLPLNGTMEENTFGAVDDDVADLSPRLREQAVDFLSQIPENQDQFKEWKWRDKVECKLPWKSQESTTVC